MVDEVNMNCGAFSSLCTFGLRCLKRSFVDQEDALGSACLLNICLEVRSILVALFYVVNIFLASNLWALSSVSVFDT